MYDWKPLESYQVNAVILGKRHSFPVVTTERGFDAVADVAIELGSDVLMYRQHEHTAIPNHRLYLPCAPDGRSVAAGTAQPSEIY